MQMNFFDMEEFAELKAEVKKKEAPKKKEGKQSTKGKSSPKPIYKLPLTMKSVAGDLVMTDGKGTEEEVKKFLAEKGPYYAICDVSKKNDAYLCRPNNKEGVEKGTISMDGIQVLFVTEEVDVTDLVGEIDLSNLFEHVLKKIGLIGLKLTLFKSGKSMVILPAESSAVKQVFEDVEQVEVLRNGEKVTIAIDPEAEDLEGQLKELDGYGTLYDLYPCGEQYYLGPKYSGVSSSSAVKVSKYSVEGVRLSLMFTSYDLSPEDFGGKRAVTEEELLSFLDQKGHPEYRLAGAVFTWLGKDKTILHVGTRGSKKGADDKEAMDRLKLPYGRQKVMFRGQVYDFLNHPCFYGGRSLENGQTFFAWKKDKADISYWVALSRFFCENCDSEVSIHLFYEPKSETFKWYVPFQQAYHASVEAERDPFLECREVSGLVKIGEFHSHGMIPAFFSWTDDEDEILPGIYGVMSCSDGKQLYRVVLGADMQFLLTEEQAAAAFMDSGEDRQSWVLGWFHQVYNLSPGNGSHYIVYVGYERARAIYTPSYEMASFFDGMFHIYSIDRGLKVDYSSKDRHFLISAEELHWKAGEPLMQDRRFGDRLDALFEEDLC